MAKAMLVRASLLHTALLGATALALFGAPFTIGEAAARVGVTSATDGDPLGKPPQEAERVLRIGIDVQANEIITTRANDRAHLVFLDGSSLTVGPNAQLTIDKFVFDPTTKKGELAINASKGVMRLVGGHISKTSPITVTTPSGSIGIRGGITILDIKERQTNSTFVFGKDMTVKGGGQTQVATRPGSMIVTNLGSPPGQPALLAQGALNGQLGQLEGRRGGSGNIGGSSGGNADQVAKTSGLSGANSSQPVRIVAPGVDNSGNRNPNDTVSSALSNANQGVQIQNLLSQQKLPPPPTQVPTSQPAPPSSQPPINLPPTATATYVGGMIGLVNGQSTTSGNYQNVWNFGTNSGSVTATFDGARFQGGTFGGNRGTFSTRPPIPSSTPDNRQLQLNGAFVGSGAQPGNQVGTFNITGNGNYKASGVFAGEKGR